VLWRYASAKAFHRLLDDALSNDPPWLLGLAPWDKLFVVALRDGDSTGDKLANHLARGTIGTGDMSILVERDLFKQKTAYSDVRIWTLDEQLSAYS